MMIEKQELHEQVSQVKSCMRHALRGLTIHENCLREFSELCEQRKVTEPYVQPNVWSLCE